jgi:hypothetical protein
VGRLRLAHNLKEKEPIMATKEAVKETPAAAKSPNATAEQQVVNAVDGDVIVTEPIATPTTAAEVVAAVEAGIDLTTGLPIGATVEPELVPREESEYVGLDQVGFDESVAALRSGSAPGAPLVANPNAVPNDYQAPEKNLTKQTVIEGAQQTLIMPAEDYKRKMATQEARRAQTLGSDNRGGVYGIRNQFGEIVGWVDGNGVQVEGPADFEESDEGSF